MFRNTRKVISGFPQRLAHLIRLSAGVDPSRTPAQISAEFAVDTGAADRQPDFASALAPRIAWLVELLRNPAETKFLLICRSKVKAMAVNEALQRCINVSSALFHEDLSLWKNSSRRAAAITNAWCWKCKRVAIELLSGSEKGNSAFAIWEHNAEPAVLIPPSFI